MTRQPQRPVTYRQRDLAAAMRAAKQTGFPVREIWIDRDGKIVIVAALGNGEVHAVPVEPNEWDDVDI